MSNRFFVDRPIAMNDVIQLDGAEAHHLLHVMRLDVGADVILFDGSGAEFPARVMQTRKREVELRVMSRNEIDRESPIQLTLAVALPKGERQSWLVEKAVELGVTELLPLLAERSVAVPSAKAIQRMRRTVIESSKQCGRNRLMRVKEPQEVGPFLAAYSTSLTARWLADPGTETTRLGQLMRSVGQWKSWVIAVGPEGGFTASELEAAVAESWQPVSLGPRTLRVETAALALASSVMLGQ